jgi:hypothetical protein
MAKQPKKVKDVIEDLRPELVKAGFTFSDQQLEVLVKLIKACD